MIGRVTLIACILVIGLAPWRAAGSPLHEAAQSGQLEVIETLLEEGSDIEAHDRGGDTPLIAAALAGRAQAARLLIDRGAAITGRSGRGFTALHAAAYAGHLEIVRILLDHGAAIDDQDNVARKTALHMAAEENHLEVAKLLLATGAQVDLLDLQGLTAASLATVKAYEEMLILLRSHGAECQSEELLGMKYHLYCMDRQG